MTREFEHIKELLKKAPVLAFFDSSKPVTLSTDASSYGIGSVLLQNGQPVAYGSASLTEPQQRYAQIEKELLAVLFACTRFHFYVFGREVEVQTDHKPLIGLKEKPYDEVSPTLQRLLLRLQNYNVKLTYVPGKYLTLADTLSRDPDTSEVMHTAENEQPINVCILATATATKFQRIREETATDPTLQVVKQYIMAHREFTRAPIKPFGQSWPRHDQMVVLPWGRLGSRIRLPTRRFLS